MEKPAAIRGNRIGVENPEYVYATLNIDGIVLSHLTSVTELGYV